MKPFRLLLCAVTCLTGFLAFAPVVLGQNGSSVHDVVSFASGPKSKVYNSDSSFLGLAQNVCQNSSSPAKCPSDATLYGFDGGGWLADLSKIPTATWIYAPGVAGSTSPAQFVQYFFETSLFMPGAPTAGVLYLAADDAAQVVVNGTFIGAIGSVEDIRKATDAQNRLHKFDITKFLVAGRNQITIRLVNGPFGGEIDDYSNRPSGVVFGGFATW